MNFVHINMKYLIITIVSVFAAYIIWTIMTSGIIYFTHDVKNPKIETVQKRIGFMFSEDSTIERMTKANITNLYAQIKIPDKYINNILLSIKEDKRFGTDGIGVRYGKFTDWCDYDINNIEYTYTEEVYEGKGIKVHSIIIIMKPENGFRKVYVFDGELAW